MKRYPLAFSFFLSVLSLGAHAADKEGYVNNLTYYTPVAGGINGHCGTSASGKNACNYFLEDYVSGKADSVMAAVPQKGANGTAGLFGGTYCSPEMAQQFKKSGCFKVTVGDHFASGYTDPKTGQFTNFNGSSKMDIVAAKAGTDAKEVSALHAASMEPAGRISGLAEPQQKVARIPAATTPPDTTTPTPVPRPTSTVSGGNTADSGSTSQSTAQAAAAAPAALSAAKTSSSPAPATKTSQNNSSAAQSTADAAASIDAAAATTNAGTGSGTTGTDNNSILQNYPMTGMLTSAANAGTSLIRGNTRTTSSSGSGDNSSVSSAGSAGATSTGGTTSNGAVNGVSFDMGTSK